MGKEKNDDKDSVDQLAQMYLSLAQARRRLDVESSMLSAEARSADFAWSLANYTAQVAAEHYRARERSFWDHVIDAGSIVLLLVRLAKSEKQARACAGLFCMGMDYMRTTEESDERFMGANIMMGDGFVEAAWKKHGELVQRCHNLTSCLADEP